MPMKNGQYPEDENDNQPSFYSEIQDIVEDVLGAADLEAHHFLVGWYNDLVGPRFALDYSPDTVALVIISGPEVFEKAVISYLKSERDKNMAFSTTDPLDEAMKYQLGIFSDELQKRGYPAHVIHDFDLFPNRKPKVLVQTAAHVAGAVEYFLKNRLTLPEYQKDKLFGVAVHPEFGGWFAIRGIVILETVQLDLKRPPPLNILQEETEIARLLREFTYNWKANIWRNIVPPKNGKTYSSDFQDYLDTPPGERWNFIQQRGLV